MPSRDDAKAQDIRCEEEMSGRLRRKTRDMKRERRHKPTKCLLNILRGIGLKSAIDIPNRKYGDPAWDYVCRFDKK